MSIRGESARLFLRQTGLRVAIFLPEILVVHFCSIVQDFRGKPIIFVSTCTKTLPKSTKKDTFHNLILCIDKMVASGIVNSTILSKFSLSEGGGGWRKTFKLSQIKILSPRQEFRPVFLSDL
jgi:hypothetical protein